MSNDQLVMRYAQLVFKHTALRSQGMKILASEKKELKNILKVLNLTHEQIMNLASERLIK
ncbi:MAG: hypothetical protein Q7S72_00325 [Candidatus Taylorbacteria bacterium]|nr:hypothetical protein [Candidatus Taylorbacteria bacterium]